MMLVLAITVSIGLGLSPAPSEATVHKTEFLGFSRQDTVCAWRVGMVRKTVDGGADRYTLIKLVDVRTGQPVATLQGSDIVHFDAKGRKKAVAKAQLAANNPPWRVAGPQKVWGKVKRLSRFRFIQLDFKDGLVRLLPDKDTEVSLKEDKKALQITGKPGAALGFVPVTRLFEGNLMPLGHFRRDSAAAEVPRAQLKVFHSHSGRAIAVLSAFETGTQPPQYVTGILTTEPNNPIASTKVGLMPMVQFQARSAQKAFKESFPAQARSYDKYIGGTY